MRNFVQPGDIITANAPRALASGEGVVVGSLFGVAMGAAASGAPVEAFVSVGIFDLTALGSDTPTAGALAYWDNTNFRITTTASGNRLVGSFVAPKAAGVTVARVRLDGVSR